MAPNAKPFPVTISLPASLVREIGRICVTYSLIEWALNRTLYDLLRLTSQEGRLAVRDPAPSDRLDMICDLMKMHDIKLPQFNFGGLKTILSECKTYRDSVAHGVWLREPGTNVIHLRRIHGSWTPLGTIGKTKRRIVLEGEEFDTEKGRLWRAAVVAALEVVRDLSVAIDAVLETRIALGTWPEKPFELHQRPRPPRGRTGDKSQPPPESSAE